MEEISGSAAGGGRRERRRQETRERLFQSAMRLLSERDYTEVTVEMITEAADVGKGTFFNYFLTKESVITYRFERQFQLLNTMLGQHERPDEKHGEEHNKKYSKKQQGEHDEWLDEKHEAQHAKQQEHFPPVCAFSSASRFSPATLALAASGGPVWERIVATMHHVGDSDASSKRLTRNLLALGLVDDTVRATSLHVHQCVCEIAEHLILAGQASGEIRDDLSSRALGNYLRGVYLSVLYQWAESETEEDIHTGIDRTLPFVWSSIRHPEYRR